jgi:hypothetical protein
MSCQQAIRAGSSVCIRVAKELIAASRWLRVATLLCRSSRSQPRNAVMVPASRWSRVSLAGGTDRSSRNQAIRSLNVSR